MFERFPLKRKRFGRAHRHCADCGARSETEPVATLDHLPPGGRAVICAVRGHGAHRRKLLDMGLTPNTSVMVRKIAPLGDPIEVFLRNYELTLRREDARRILIREVQD